MKKSFVAVIIGAVLALFMAGAVSAKAEAIDYTLTLLQEGGLPSPYSSENEPDGLREEIKAALTKSDESFKVVAPDLSVDELANVYEDTINHAPKLSHVLGKVGIEENEGSYIIYPAYRNEISLMSSSAERQAMNDILAQIKPGMSDVEKLLAVHDYMVLHYEYDYTFSIHSAQEFFENKRGVCQAYTLAFGYIMDELGIEWKYVRSSPMNHAWNLVKLNGAWYHIDVTWDDPGWHRTLANGEDVFGDSYGVVRHRYFLVSDSAMEDDEHNHYGWDSDRKRAVDSFYDDYFWTEVQQPMIYNSGAWYWGHKYSTESVPAGINSYRFSEGTVKNLLNAYRISAVGIYNGYIYFIPDNLKIYMAPLDNINEAVAISEFYDYENLNGTYFENGYLRYALADYKYYEKIMDPYHGKMAAYNNYYIYRNFYDINLRGYKYNDYKVTWDVNEGVLSVSNRRGIIPDYDYFEKPWNEYRDEITKIVVKNGITEIGSNAFSGLSAVKSISLPDTLEKIGNRAFYGCSGIRMLEIPESVKYIDEDAFCFCSGLAVMFLRPGLEIIEPYAFSGCSALAEIYYYGDEQEFADIEISDGNSRLTGAAITYDYEPPMLMHMFDYDEEMVVLWLYDNKALVGEDFECSLKKYSGGRVSNYNGAEYTYDSEIIGRNGGGFYGLGKGETTVSIKVGEDEKSFKLYVGEEDNMKIFAYFGYGITPIVASYSESGEMVECKFLNPDEVNSLGVDYVDYGGICKMMAWGDIDNTMYPAGEPLVLNGGAELMSASENAVSHVLYFDSVPEMKNNE